ncbi:MAG: hypothetical protein N2169_07730, partial [bacterium]|nr:hypothetical protein [bacterium]
SIALSTKLAYNNAVAYLNKKGINVKPKEYTDFESKLKSELVEYGVLSSGLVSELSNFKDTKNILTHVLKVIRDSQEFRENILRIACYIDGKKALNKSEADALSWIDKWKWYKDDVQSIIDFGDYQKAIAKISSDYLINYQTTSKMYNLIFRSLIFPFGHFYLQINKIIGKMLLTKPLKTLGWLSFIPTFCAVWNNYMGNYFYPDNKITEAYNELPDEIRHQPVIVLGYDKYGFIKAINFGFFPPDILVGGSIINQLISRTINIAFHPENSTTYLKFLHNLFDGTLDRETKKIKLLLNPIFRFVYGGMTGVDYVDGRYIFDVHPEQRHYLSMNQKFTKLLQYFSSVMIPIAGTYIAQTTKKIPVEEKEAFYEIFRNIFGYDEVNGFNYLIGMRRYDPYIYSNEKIKEYQELSTRMLQFIVDMKKEYYKSDLPVEDFIRTPEVISKVSTFIRDNNFKTKEGIKEISERIIESLNDEYTFYLKILSMRNRAVNNGDFKKAKVLNEALSKTDIKVKQSIKTIYKAIKIEEASKGEK